MNLLQMRTVLRRQVQDTAGVQWTDVECDQALNESYYQFQSSVQSVDPEAVVNWDYMNSVAAQNWYPLPPTFGIIAVRIKDSATAGYVKLDRKRLESIESMQGTTQYYTQRGEWIGIFPAPSLGVASGIELQHRPIHTLTADADFPKVKLPLHYGIVLGAKIWLLGDTNEQSKVDEDKLAKLLDNISRWYGQNYDDPESFTLEGL